MISHSKIWVDADACPGDIKEIIVRAAERLKIKTTFVANKTIRLSPSQVVSFLLVPGGFDVADAEIVQLSQKNDIAITADIPLAAQLVDKEVVVIDMRGTLYDKENIGERVSVRDFMQEARGAGMQTGGPRAFSSSDKQKFAATFDKMLMKQMKIKT